MNTTISNSKRSLRIPVGRRTGVLGIDIGTNSIKMARMDNIAGRWSVTNRIILPFATAPKDLASALRDGLLSEQLAILRNRPLSLAHKCVCILPRSVTDLRTVDVPNGSPEEVNQMAEETLRDCFPLDFDQRVTQLWRHSESAGEMATVTCVSLENAVAEAVVEDLETVGLNCVGIECHPIALARAAHLSTISRSTQPVGLLDWGDSTATLVIVRDGQPEYIRTFRGCSGSAAIKLVSEGLMLSETDTRHILSSCGVPAPGQSGSGTVITKSIERLLTPEVTRIADELQKTLLYLRHHIPVLMPTRLVLFGGMATVPNIAPVVQQRCGIETHRWSLDGETAHISDAVYAAAMAISVGGVPK